MARGEQGTRERGAGLAIAAAFGVLCLVVLFGVLSTTRACDDGSRPPPPYTVTAPEPFPGAFAAASRLGTLGCRPTGPGMTPASHRAALDWDLIERGYVPDGPWSPPTAMPASIEASGCGVVAAVADGGFVTAGIEDGRRMETPCGGERAAFATCGAAPLRIEGQGNVVHRIYLTPGLTAADVEALELDPAVAVAHAEAEGILAALGYEAKDELVVEDLGPVPGGHYHTARPPRTPEEGCVLWVGVASGLGNATVTWSGPGGSGFVPANVSSDAAADVGTFALFACGADAGRVQADAEASVYAPRAGPASVVYRAFAPPSGPAPATTGAPPASTVAGARVVDQSAAALPDTVPFVRPDAG